MILDYCTTTVQMRQLLNQSEVNKSVIQTQTDRQIYRYIHTYIQIHTYRYIHTYIQKSTYWTKISHSEDVICTIFIHYITYIHFMHTTNVHIFLWCSGQHTAEVINNVKPLQYFNSWTETDRDINLLNWPRLGQVGKNRETDISTYCIPSYIIHHQFNNHILVYLSSP